MPEVRNYLPTPLWQNLTSSWLASDAIVQVANVAAASVVLFEWRRIEHVPAYLMFHALMAVLFQFAARYDDQRSGASPLGRLIHNWLPAAFVITVYFELGLLIPQIHPFNDYRYDRWLHAIDVWMIGDPTAWVARVANPTLSDVLSVCYFSYYPYTIIVPAFLYARGRYEDYQRATSITLLALLVPYACYVMFPAIGPHHLFDGWRPPALDGHGLARRGYAAVRDLALEPPDAFPSGHALFGMVVPALAWRWYRALFLWVLPVGVGIVVATFYLRFHYAADIVASALAAPAIWKLGLLVEQRLRPNVQSERSDTSLDY